MLAINRMAKAKQLADQEQATRWANAWATFAKYGPKYCNDEDSCASAEHLALAR
jgi:hypothetical protein